jgi:anti-sigma-K factor RskA
MNCEQTQELLPAYVLGVLEPDEVSEVEAHLRTGHEHDDELVELRATVFALDRFAEAKAVEADVPAARAPAPVPTPIRERVSRLRGWLALGPMVRTPVPASTPVRARVSAPRGWLTLEPAWRTTAIAASLAIAIFAAGWFASGLGSGGASHDVSLAIQGPAGQSISLSGAPSEKRVSVSMAGFQRLGADRVYEIWAIRDGVWSRIGVCNPHEDGTWSGDFPFAIRSREQIALTIESAGGGDAPTTPPVLLSTT